MKKKHTSRTITGLGSYNWVDHDPAINLVLGAMGEAHITKGGIESLGGPKSQTLRNWETGKTREPRNSTVEAALRCCGFRRVIERLPTNFDIHKPVREPSRGDWRKWLASNARVEERKALRNKIHTATLPALAGLIVGKDNGNA